jgi:hypothetical protein
MSGSLTPAAFRSRFALATFPDGGVVVDLETGSYSRLNASGAAVLEELERADTTEAAVAAVAQRLRATTAIAGQHVATLMSALGGAGLRHEPPDPFRYRAASDGGYDLWHGTTCVLRVDEAARKVTMVAMPQDLPLRPYDYVSAMAPKLLFLRGITVMHGSGCVDTDDLVGICGKSRAGKTTTARTLARHGRELVSEDLLVFAPDLTAPAVYLEGERRAHRWSIDVGRALESGQGATADIDPLVEAASGPTRRLGRLWFLDAARRGETFALRALSRTRTLELVLANHFLGAGGASIWRRHVGACRSIASAVAAFELDPPLGLDRLDEAIARYTTSSAS